MLPAENGTVKKPQNANAKKNGNAKRKQNSGAAHKNYNVKNPRTSTDSGENPHRIKTNTDY